MSQLYVDILDVVLESVEREQAGALNYILTKFNEWHDKVITPKFELMDEVRILF